MMPSEVSTDFFTRRKNVPSGARRFGAGVAAATTVGSGVAATGSDAAGAFSTLSVLLCLEQLAIKMQAAREMVTDRVFILCIAKTEFSRFRDDAPIRPVCGRS
jgi:hypothetical protein